MISSDLVADCFELAWDIRTLDMRAAPYDLADLGFEPVRIETVDGKAEYVEAGVRRACEASSATAYRGMRAPAYGDTLIRRRTGIVLGFAFAAIFAEFAPVMLWWSFEPVLHTVGTVTKVKDGTCYVQYTDRAGAEHTHVNGGGKTGCRDDEGDKTDLYYPPRDPEASDTMSPRRRGSRPP